jgi:PAS domain S-box-containing protein
MTLLKKFQGFSTGRLSVVIAILYALIACASLQLAFEGTNASPVWPPSGIAFIAIWFLGYRVWPGIWLGAFIANMVVFIHHGWTAIPATSVSALIGAGNSIEGLFGVFLLRSFTEEMFLLSKIRDIFKFVFAVLVACLTSSVIGTSAVYFIHPVPGISFDMIWFTWWLGDVVGILVIASTFLTFHKKLWQISSWKNIFEAVLVVLVLITVNAGVFMGKFPEYGFYSHVTYLVLPFAIWSTYRFGFPGATVSILATSVLAVVGSSFHLGPFISQRIPEDLVIVECFIGVIAVTVLTLAAALYERQKAEEDIKHNEARFRSLVENSFEVVTMIDTEAKVLYSSPPTKNILGYETSELLGRSMFEWMHPDDVPGILEQFQGLLKIPGSIVSATCRMQRKDGAWRWLEGSGHNLLHEPAIAAVVINYRDITERKKYEEVQVHFASIVESSEEAITSKSLDGTITSWNKGAEKLYGYTAEEIIGRSVDILVPEDKKEELVNMFQDLEEGRKIELLETIRRRKDGSLIDVLLTVSPLRNNLGLLTGVSSIARDITERKKSQLAVEESERRFRTMADTAPVMIWMSGADGLYSFFNKAWLTFAGRSVENELGNGWRKGIHPQDLPRCTEIYLKAFEAREKFTLDYRLKRADGVYRWVLDTGVPRFSSDGYFGGFIGSCIDITERKMAEEILIRDKESLEKLVDERSKELIKTQKELKQFSRLADIGTLAATVAHELRNPLGVIHLAAYNLKKERNDLGDNKHLVNIEKKVWEGNQIIDNLLSYARIKIPNYENVRILNILDECVSSAQGRFGEKGINIEKKYEDGLDFIETDANQVREIFLNILNNACQAIPTPPGGTVELKAGREGDMIKVSVKDSGVGIDQEDLDKVFEPFFTRKSKGTGLGLTICNELVNLHQGKIEIKSRLGEGATVSVFLPVHRRNHAEIASD